MDPNSKRFMQTQMMWIVLSLGISFALSFLIPFPYSLFAIVGVFLGINYFMRKKQLRMMGRMGGISSMFGGGEKPVVFYCITCGFKHNKRSCPRCGSTGRRIE
ncbi:MAG: hypothetical protein AUH71_06230 [Thaumarchaeota archaeon 13_1_40CM_4_48_7]|nr:MAG: hypothetical protein AUH71_06230 [Thaumarchaeota archaeon 13_1_40CM_4_48_7]